MDGKPTNVLGKASDAVHGNQRKPYVRPEVQQWGTVGEWTEMSDMTNNDGSASASMSGG